MTAYFVSSAGNDGNDGLTGNPWLTVGKVNGETFSAGDTISFNGGDTFNDAALTPPSPGTSGNLIVFTSYGTGQAIIDGASFSNAVLVNVDYVAIDNLKLQNTDASSGSYVFKATGSTGFQLRNGCHISGTTAKRGISVQGSSTAGLIDDFTVEDIGGGAMYVESSAHTCTFSNGTVGDDGLVNNGDGITIAHNAGNNITLDNVTFDQDPTATASENSIDIKGGIGHVVKNCTTVRVKNRSVLVHDPDSSANPASVTFQDCDFANTSAGWASINDQQGGGVTVVFDRCDFHDQESTSEAITIGSTAGSVPVVTFNACAFIVESGASTDEIFEWHRGTLTLDNCSLVMRNGSGSGLQILGIRSTISGLLTVRNCIFDADNMLLIDEQAGSTATFSFLNNLFERGDQTTGWFDFDTETTCADEADVGATAPLDDASNVSGDPIFASEDSTLATYLRIDPANSPAAGKGDDIFGGSTDLKGIPYGSPKNIGCRSNSIRHKRTNLRQMMAI